MGYLAEEQNDVKYYVGIPMPWELSLTSGLYAAERIIFELMYLTNQSTQEAAGVGWILYQTAESFQRLWGYGTGWIPI